ncbi:MAG: diguanylate cyclase [Woeseiaceae bacterium]|nr:diguanylate cyclase [Woeseiaceae bacterium]
MRARLADRKDSEHGQALVRIVIVSIVVLYSFSSYFAARVDDAGLQATRLVALMSISLSVAIFAAIVASPAASVPRRLIGMLHDVTAISLAIYFGEEAGAAVAVVYLWITIGNGFRFGIAYLYACALACISGFLLVYFASDFWRGQTSLSVNILLAMLVVPPYVGSLLKSLHAAKDRLQEQASFDSLTGLLRRSEMEAALESLFASNRSGHVVLFCDLDHFKEVNDVAGHAAGDKLLADVGEIVKGSIRRDDLCGRMGGDEFCILLRSCSLEKGREIAEQLRSRITSYRLAWGTDYFWVGVSIGVAPTDAVNDADSLIRLADAACYAAKNAGKNKVHVVDPRVSTLDTQKIRCLYDERGRPLQQGRQSPGTS